jgi:hypothetical protein
MRKYFAVGSLALCSLAIGCGGGNGSFHPADVRGNWQIVLGESQADAIGMEAKMPPRGGQTQFDVTFGENNGFLTMPLPSGSVPAWNIGCVSTDAHYTATGDPGYWEYGGPTSANVIITLTNSAVLNPDIAFTLSEQVGNKNVGYSSTQDLVFVGTVDSPTTMHGKVADNCTGFQPTWTATKIATIPTP